MVCFVLKNMGENLSKIAMHITNDFVTSAVGTNFKNGVATWCYFDEFHILLRDALTASYFVAVWKMLRKKGCVPSALTQNVKDLLASREIENILDNTDFMILLSQAQSDRTILAKQLGISEHQLSYITHSNSGEGLLFYGNVTIPFVDRFPRGEIYDLLTTRPEDMPMENRQNKPKEEGQTALPLTGHGGQKFHTGHSEQAKLPQVQGTGMELRMKSREERLNRPVRRLANQKPPKKPGPIKRIARIAGHEPTAFLHGKVYQEEQRQCRRGGRSPFCGAFRRGRAALWAAQGTQGHPGAPGQGRRPCGVPVHQGHGRLPFPQVRTGAAGGAERRRPVMAPPQAETGVSRRRGKPPSRPPKPPNKPCRPRSGLSGKRRRSSSGILWGRCLRWAACWWC